MLKIHTMSSVFSVTFVFDCRVAERCWEGWMTLICGRDKKLKLAASHPDLSLVKL